MKSKLLLTGAVFALLGAASLQAHAAIGFTLVRAGIPAGGGIFDITGSLTNNGPTAITITDATLTNLPPLVDFSSPNDQFSFPLRFDAQNGGVTIGSGQTVSYDTAPNNTNPSSSEFLAEINDTQRQPYGPGSAFTETLKISGTDASGVGFEQSFDIPVTYGTSAAVPEPGSLALLVGGMMSGGLFLARRRKK